MRIQPGAGANRPSGGRRAALSADQTRALAGVAERVRAGGSARVLLAGPDAASRRVAAEALAGETGRPLVSVAASKYIGETEKNLAALFDRAKRTGAALYFDEADALFGKRTGVADAHDRYANQEVSYLLGRIEKHDGLVILATNQRAELHAESSRFDSVIGFPKKDDD